MTDRRSFLARVAGVLGAAVASKHVTVAPAELPPAPIAVPKAGPPVVPFRAPNGDVIGPYSMPGPSTMEVTYVGGGFRDVMFEGKEATEVWEVTDYGYPHRADGYFWGKITTRSPVLGLDRDTVEEYRFSMMPEGFQEFTYGGWVKVGTWPLWMHMRLGVDNKIRVSR